MKAWTEEMMAGLRDGLIAGRSYREIAAELGVSRAAAIGKADRLGLVGGSAASPIRAPIVTAPWSAEDDRRLKDGIAAGKSARTVAAAIGRGAAATAKRVKTLGLARRTVVAASPKASAPSRAGVTSPKPRPRREIVVDAGKPDAAGHVRFIERRAFQCSWIVDGEVPIRERLVCGARTSGATSWCAHHRLICRDVARAAA